MIILNVNPEYVDAYIPYWHEFKRFPCGTSSAVVFATVHQQQLPLPHYLGIDDVTIAGSSVQTNHVAPHYNCYIQPQNEIHHDAELQVRQTYLFQRPRMYKVVQI
jgi:hypothetical protein